MVWSTTPIPPMRAAWTACGACTSGSTALPGGATSRACGGATTTSTTGAEHGFGASVARRLVRCRSAGLRRQRGADGVLVRVHVGDGRYADARRLGDVDDVDADARADVARRRGLVPRYVGRDDGGDDAAVPGSDAVALSSGRRQDRANVPWAADHARGRRLFLRLDRPGNGRLSPGRRAGGGRDAAAAAGARGADRGRRGRAHRRRAPVLPVEGASPCLLPAGSRAQWNAAGRRRHGLAAWPAPRTALHPLLCPSDGDTPVSYTHLTLPTSDLV